MVYAKSKMKKHFGLEGRVYLAVSVVGLGLGFRLVFVLFFDDRIDVLKYFFGRFLLHLREFLIQELLQFVDFGLLQYLLSVHFLFLWGGRCKEQIHTHKSVNAGRQASRARHPKIQKCWREKAAADTNAGSVAAA